MASIDLSGAQFLLRTTSGPLVLLDLDDCGDERVSQAVREFLVGCFGECEAVFCGEEEETRVPVMAGLILCVKQFLQAGGGLQVLEIGCIRGTLSCFLARAAAFFGGESQVYCLTDTLFSDGSNPWFDKASLAGPAIERTSLITTAYGAPILRGGFFDIVVVNGSAYFEDPAPMLLQALRCAKVGGMLLCLAIDQPLLSSCLQAYAGEVTEYELSPKVSLLCRTVDSEDKALLGAYLG